MDSTVIPRPIVPTEQACHLIKKQANIKGNQLLADANRIVEDAFTSKPFAAPMVSAPLSLAI